MADRPPNAPRHGGGRPRDRPRGDDREHRRRDDDRTHGRYRSRSPRDRTDRGDRRDRKRDYDGDRRRRDEPERGNRERERYDARDRPRDRGGRRDREAGRDGDKPRQREENGPKRDDDRKANPAPTRDQTRQRTASPKRRSPSPLRSEDRDMDLPTRTRKEKSGTPSAHPVHIKLSGKDTDRGRHDTPDEGTRYEERERGTPMDEDVEEDDIVVEEDGLADMQAMMGFGSFGTTKGKHVLGNNVSAVRKEKKTEYRQYMNRVGGFNRPLSPGR